MCGVVAIGNLVFDLVVDWLFILLAFEHIVADEVGCCENTACHRTAPPVACLVIRVHRHFENIPLVNVTQHKHRVTYRGKVFEISDKVQRCNLLF